MDMLKASIKTYTYNEYFKSVKWITRKGVVSLSITPTSKLYGRTYKNNANVLAVHAATAWSLLYKKHKSSSKWKNTASRNLIAMLYMQGVIKHLGILSHIELKQIGQLLLKIFAILKEKIDIFGDYLRHIITVYQFKAIL